MSNKNLGEQFKDIADAISSYDYSDLNNKIKNTVDHAINEVNRATTDFIPHGGKQEDPFKGTSFEQTSGHPNKEYQRKNQGTQYNQKQQGYRQQSQQRTKEQFKTYQRNARPAVTYKRGVKGSVSSILNIVFGSLGLAGFAVPAIVFLCLWDSLVFKGTTNQILSVVFSGLTLVSAGMLYSGIKRRKLINRYHKYSFLLAKNKFCDIKRLAETAGKSKRFVVRDLKKMITLSMFPEGRFDEQKTYFMLNDETYQQYIASQESYQERKKEEQMQKEKAEQQKKEMDPELLKAIESGKAYLKEIRKANDDIPGEKISRKLDQLEELIKKIFFCVEKHPEKLPEIRKFMEYYLPITMKLVNAYKEFDSQPIQGENITKSKKEIEETLDTIDLAFQKLLDSLYEDEAMEVYSDISVLNALFAQEGLTKDDFNIKESRK